MERNDGDDCGSRDRSWQERFSLVGLDEAGKAILRRRMKREGLSTFAERLSPCVVATEACCGAHWLGRIFAARGHEVRLMSPEYVRPYVKAQKNDDRDAEAIAAAIKGCVIPLSRSNTIWMR
jgi:transposase